MSGTPSERQPSDETAAAVSPAEDAAWRALLAWRQGGAEPVGATPALAALIELYRPFCAAAPGVTVPGRSVIIAHLGQSLDGRIATVAGLSRWVTGPADLLHTHRLRALADAVIVGAGTVAHDDPLLTVRRCAGPSPVRVVIDPDGRLAPSHRVFRDRAAPTLVLSAADKGTVARTSRDIEIVRLPRHADGIAPRDIIDSLAARGFHRLLVEGGGITVSRFLAARCLDRLHLTVAPVLLGSGRPSLALPEILDPADGLRPRVRQVALGEDRLFDCSFRD